MAVVITTLKTCCYIQGKKTLMKIQNSIFKTFCDKNEKSYKEKEVGMNESNMWSAQS
jgi:hypothetical protein